VLIRTPTSTSPSAAWMAIDARSTHTVEKRALLLVSDFLTGSEFKFLPEFIDVLVNALGRVEWQAVVVAMMDVSVRSLDKAVPEK